MDTELARRLLALPSLDRKYAFTSASRCKICQANAPLSGVTDFWKSTGGYVFGKSGITVDWYRCSKCDFLFTDFFDNWTSDDFSRHVYNDEYIKVDPEYVGTRSTRVFEFLQPLLSLQAAPRVLDYGGGAGALSFLMREKNIDAISYDPFSSPVRPEGKFDVITCVEVMEHSPNPSATMGDIASLLAPGGCILLGISLQPQDINKLGASWWYCAPRNGHCSTYSVSTLARLGSSHNLKLHHGNRMNWCSWCFSDHPSEISRIIGPVFENMVLGAPKENKPGWYGIEKAFRWSNAETITWEHNVTEAPAVVRAKLLYHAVPFPGFAQQCKLTVQGKSVQVVPGATTDIELKSPGVVTAVLTNSLLFCPAENGLPDNRKLGIALQVE